MTMQLAPSALAQTFDDRAYNPVDILKYQLAQKKQEKQLKEKREYDTLNKLYDTGLRVATNDYGIYNKEIQASYTDALARSTKAIRDGASPVDTLPYLDDYSKQVSMSNEINANEKKFAEYIESNTLMSPEEKKKAIEDRRNQTFYDEDGNLLKINDAYARSKDQAVNVYNYISGDSIWKNFVKNSSQTTRQDKVTGGVSTTVLYPWQKENEQGEVVVDLQEQPDGSYLLSSEVYAKFMGDKDNNAWVMNQAREIADQAEITDEGKISKIAQEIVTDFAVNHGDEGSKRLFKESPYNKYTMGDYDPIDYSLAISNVKNIPIPKEGSENLEEIGMTGKMGMNITSFLHAFNRSVGSAYIDTDGVVHYDLGKKDNLGFTKWATASSPLEAAYRVANPEAQQKIQKVVPTTDKKVSVVTEEAERIPITQYAGMTVTYNGNTHKVGFVNVEKDGTVKAFIGGKSVRFENKDEWYEKIEIDPSVVNEKDKLPSSSVISGNS